MAMIYADEQQKFYCGLIKNTVSTDFLRVHGGFELPGGLKLAHFLGRLIDSSDGSPLGKNGQEPGVLQRIMNQGSWDGFNGI